MQKMTGLDLEFAAAELAPLQGRRMAKIRRTENGIFLFKIGSEELLFEPGVRLHLTRQVLQATERPDGFVSLLRKSLEGKTALQIRKVENERIVEIGTKSKERLVFELFRKGNVILVGEDGTILACLQKDETGGRRVARGEKYAPPAATAFEVRRPDKTAFCVQENEKGEPVSYSANAEKGGRQFETFSEALDYYYANLKDESAAEQAAREKIAKLEERLSLQKAALARLDGEKDEAKKSGEAIYAAFAEVEGLLSAVKQMKKEGKGEEEINAALAALRAKISGTKLDWDAP